MKRATKTIRLHPTIQQLVERDILDKKFANWTDALNSIAARYYRIKKLPPVEDLRKKGARSK